MERAEEAFDRALQVITIDNDRGFWAEIDLRLAEVRRLQASTTVGLEERLKLLDEATKSCRDVLKILRKDTESEEWADAQATLGLVLYNHAQLVKDAGARRHMFDSALEALSAALKILTPENQPFKWTRAQRALGDTSRLRSEVSNRDNKKALLRQAVEAYTRALSPVRRLPYWQPLEQAEILDVLSACAFTLGMLFDGTARADQMLDAATRSQASAELYAGQHLPERAVQAVHNFAKARNEWALVDSDDSGNELLVEAIEVTANALSYLSGQPTDEAKRMRAYIHLDLAQLYWARANLRDQRPAMAIENDIETTIKYADLALDYFTRDNGSTEYQQAGRIRRNAQAKARAVAPSTDTTATAD